MNDDSKTAIIIVLLVLVLSLFGTLFYIAHLNIIDDTKEEWYGNGYRNATIVFNNALVKELGTNGKLVINYPINETTAVPVTLVPYKGEINDR